MTTHYQRLPERGAALSLVVESRLPSGSRVRLRSKEVAWIFVVGFDLCEASPAKTLGGGASSWREQPMEWSDATEQHIPIAQSWLRQL